MKACVYTRVSTDSQEREGTSLETQMSACLAYCGEKGYEVVREFSESYSGLALDRPKLSELRQMVRAGDVDVVVCYCLDRLSRDPTHGVILTQELERHHVTLEAVIETVDSTELGKLITYIRGFASKLEAEKIAERTMRGKKAKALQGEITGKLSDTYGYTYIPKALVDGGRLTANAVTSDVVRTIFRYFTEDRLSIREIARKLTSAGVPTPHKGPAWCKSSIARILANPTYVGEVYAFKMMRAESGRDTGKSRYKKDIIVSRPRDQWIRLSQVAEPLVTREAFDLAQLLLKSNKETQTRNTLAKRQYLLSGFVFCGQCGKRYQGVPEHGDTRVYRCSGRPLCHNVRLDGDTLEAAVWTKIADLLSNPAVMLAEIEARKQGNGADPLLDNMTALDKRIKRLEVESEKLLDLYLEGTLAKPEYQRRKGANDAQKQELTTERATLAKRIAAVRQAGVDKGNVLAFLEVVKGRVKGMTFERKKVTLAALAARVVINGKDDVQLEWVIPPSGAESKLSIMSRSH